MGAKRGPQAPDVVGQLSADSLGMAHALTASISGLEETLEKFFRLFTKRGPIQAPGCVEVGDREGGVPRRVDAPVDVRRRRLRPLLAIHGVVVLVRVLAAGVQPGLRVAKDSVEVTGGGVEHRIHSGQGKRAHEAGVVLHHLLEMRDAPILGRRVAEEAALDVVVRAASRHLVEGMDGHLAQLWVGAELRLFQQQEDGVGLREFGRAAEAPVLRIVGGGGSIEDRIHHPVVERSGAPGDG